MLYGLYSAKVDDAGAAEARAEHQEAKDLILLLEGMEPGSGDFVTTMTKLNSGDAGCRDGARKAEVEAQVRADRRAGMAPSTTSQKPTGSPESGW